MPTRTGLGVGGRRSALLIVVIDESADARSVRRAVSRTPYIRVRVYGRPQTAERTLLVPS